MGCPDVPDGDGLVARAAEQQVGEGDEAD